MKDGTSSYGAICETLHEKECMNSLTYLKGHLFVIYFVKLFIVQKQDVNVLYLYHDCTSFAQWFKIT